MSSVVADTHTIVWYLANDPRLSPAAILALNQATASGEPIYVSSICLVELTYLAEKDVSPSPHASAWPAHWTIPSPPAAWSRSTAPSPTPYRKSIAPKSRTSPTA
jgi:hypothetical protein